MANPASRWLDARHAAHLAPPPATRRRVRAIDRYDDWLRLREVDQDLTFGEYLRRKLYARDWRTPR